MQDAKLIKTSSSELAKVSSSIELTNKLLASENSLLIPFRRFNKWGFSDFEKNIIIECVFDSVRPFYSNIAVVKLNNKYGIIDIKGDIKGEIIYQCINDLSEELIGARLNYKFGFIDTSGKTIIPFQYDAVDRFSNGLAKVYVKNNSNEVLSCLINRSGILSGSWVFDPDYNTKVRINEDGTKTELTLHLPIFLFDDETVLDLSEGIGNNTENNYSDGRSIFERDGKFGFIDKSHNEVIANIYDYVMPFSNGIALTKLNNKYGYINTKGHQYWED